MVIRSEGVSIFWAALVTLSLALTSCQSKEVGSHAGGAASYQDRFESTALSDQWTRGVGEAGSGAWVVQDGWLRGQQLKNDPLWLQIPLTKEAVIRFDARAKTQEGDVKFELFGDGKNHASGYVLIHGGWKNQLDVIARLDEHGKDRVERRTAGVVPGKVYRHRVEWRGDTLQWYVDGKMFLEFVDPDPLHKRPQNRYFGFSNWSAEVEFDNLVIETQPTGQEV